jgi:catechol 2,3-dioxygenase-like lactoylglutathione lyase family enzyme
LQNQAKATEVIQVGIFVKDVNETAKKLEELLGIGPFEIFEPDYKDLTYRGKPGKFGVKIGLAKAGPIQIELTTPVHGETIFSRRKRYGIHHLGIRTDNMERSIEEMKKKGFKVIQSGRRPGTKWAYLDTEKKTGLIFELIERKH